MKARRATAVQHGQLAATISPSAGADSQYRCRAPYEIASCNAAEPLNGGAGDTKVYPWSGRTLFRQARGPAAVLTQGVGSASNPPDRQATLQYHRLIDPAGVPRV